MDPASKEFYDTVKGTTSSVITTTLISNAAFNFIFSASMTQLLDTIGILSIIAHNTLVNVALPANVQTFYSIILPIIAFDVVETETVD